MTDTKLCQFCGEEIRRSAIKCKFCGSELTDGYHTQMASDTQVKIALASKYEILEVIGKGGMATVYKALQKNLNRLVALKVVHPNLIHDTEFLNRFHREAQLAASLNHPNIVMIYDEGSVNGVHFISMEYLDGKDLHCIIRERGKLSVEETISIITPIAEALDYAHTRGLVHRDVKSANILVTSAGRPVLTDFGIAHAASGTKLTQAGSVIGTPEYMSPEQASGKELDGRSDIFSLGIVLYECLTGKVPFKSDNPLTTIHGIIYDATPPARGFNSKIPGWLDNIILRTLSKSPDERFPSGIILAVYLRDKKTPAGSFASSHRKSKQGSQKNYAKTRSSKSNKTIIALIIVFAIIIVASTIVYFAQKSDSGFDLAKAASAPALSASGEIAKPDITPYLTEGMRLMNEGRYEDAKGKFKEALIIEPNNTLVAGRITEIDRIIALNGEISKLTTSADMYFSNNDLQKARVDYMKLLEIDKQNEHAGERIKIIDQKLNEKNRSQSASNLQKYISSGDSLFRIGQYEKAKSAYTNALKIKPKDEHITNQLEKIELYLTNNKVDYELLMEKANASIRAGRLSQAGDEITEALKYMPGDPTARNRLDSINSVIQKRIKTEIDGPMVLVQGGNFEMGSLDADDDQKPIHDVNISSFYIDKYEVTVKQYRIFCEATGRNMPSEPSYGWKDNLPIVNVRWDDAAAYARWAGKRLPTEAEWEFAARGGNLNKGYKYSGGNDAGRVATYQGNSSNKPAPVDSKSPNEMGIFNMSGNVWEWCNDYYDAAYYKKLEKDNPKGPASGNSRVIRGGAFDSITKDLLIKTRADSNGRAALNIGFRCVKNQ